MSRFIPIKQMQTLRESARSGDERAKRILAMQLSGTEDFSQLLEEYFTPQPEPEISQNSPVVEQKATEPVDKALGQETPFEMYLRENEITLDENNRNDVIREFEEMTGNKVEMPEKVEEVEEVVEEKEDVYQPLIDDEVEAIEGYQKFLNELLPSDMCEEKKAFISSRIGKIIDDEKQHIEILKELQRKCEEHIEE